MQRLFNGLIGCFAGVKPAGAMFVVLLALLAGTAHSQTVRHVWTNSPSPDGQYLTWTNAARSIQEAVNAAAAGDTIIVTNGIYDAGGISNYPGGCGLTNRVAINKAVTVQSVNGPSNTFIIGRWHVQGDTNNICGSNAVRCVYMAAGAKLIGFTLTNGATAAGGGFGAPYGGGIYCANNTAVISNCAINGNAAWTYGGGAYYGTYYDCTIAGNVLLTAASGAGVFYADIYRCNVLHNKILTASGMGGGVYAGNVYDSIIIGNFARTGAGVRIANVYNSLIYNNTAGFNGGGASECPAMYNCVIVGNTGTRAGGVNTDIISTNYNCVVYGNIGAGWFSGGVYGQGRLVLINCIVLNNAGGNYAGTVDFSYSCASPLPAGEGNMNVDPLFLDPGSGMGPSYVLGDYRLRRDSPCIDRGLTLPWALSDPQGCGRDRDFYGGARLRHRSVDIGAHELRLPRGSFFNVE